MNLILLLLVLGVAAAQDTVVDVLSSAVEFTTFLTTLQRTGYIPILNQMDNFTLLAPVNSAFVDRDSMHIEDYILRGNLRNAKLPPGTHVLLSREGYPVLYEIPDGHGSSPSSSSSSPSRVGGSEVVEEISPQVQHAHVVALGQKLARKPPLQQVLSRHSKHWASWAPQDVDGKTFFVPADLGFTEIEVGYLDSEFGSRDRELLLRTHTVDGIVGGDANATVLNELGHELTYRGSGAVCENQHARVKIKTPNVVYSSGMVHIIESPLAQPINFTLEKYLYGMGLEQFVSELKGRKLGHLIEEDRNQTLFVPVRSKEPEFQSTKNNLLYHFVDEKVDLEQGLYSTLACTKKLNGGCQKIKITRKKNTWLINGRHGIVGKPVVVGGTTVYLYDQGQLALPLDLLPSVAPLHHCSKSLMLLHELNLIDSISNGMTILMPCFESWDKLGLTGRYLQTNITALNHVFKSMMLQTLLYSTDENRELDVANLNNERVRIRTGSRSANRTGTLPVAYLGYSLEIGEYDDMLFNQGVVHAIDEVVFPPEVTITLDQLLRFTASLEFITFLEKFPVNADSMLVPTPRSLMYDSVNINSTWLEDWLLLHSLDAAASRQLALCSDDSIPTRLHNVTLKCRDVTGDGSLLVSIEGGQDREVRIINRGCTSSDNSSCIFMIDKPFSLAWVHKPSERLLLRLPGVALAFGVILGVIFIMVVFVGLTLVVSKRAVPETQSLVPSVRVSDYGSHQRTPSRENFESSYSQNAQCAPIDVV